MVRSVVLVVLLLVVAGHAASWLNWFTYGVNRQRPGRSGRDHFRSICRTINPDNYAFPGRVPYPAAPLCPY
jgi:hypothetical protein